MPRTPVHDTRVRLSLHISPEVKERLESLQKRSEAESLTEVIRRALMFYEGLLNLRDADGTIVFRDRKGREENVLVMP